MARKKKPVEVKNSRKKKLMIVLTYDATRSRNKAPMALTVSNTSNTTNASLLGLPLSVRNQIFHLSFGTQDIPCIYGDQNKTLSEAPGILLACKQTYIEAVENYYASSVFRFAYRDHAVEWLSKIPNVRWKLITNVTQMLVQSPRRVRVDPSTFGAQLAEALKADLERANIRLNPGVVRGLILPSGSNRKSATNNMIIHANNSKRGLFSLPAELREKIFDGVFEDGHWLKYNLGGHVLPKPPGLLLSCRQAYVEGLAKYYHTLAFDSGGAALQYLSGIPVERRSLIKNIYINQTRRPKGDAEDVALELQLSGRHVRLILQREGIHLPDTAIKQRCTTPGERGRFTDDPISDFPEDYRPVWLSMAAKERQRRRTKAGRRARRS